MPAATSVQGVGGTAVPRPGPRSLGWLTGLSDVTCTVTEVSPATVRCAKPKPSATGSPYGPVTKSGCLLMSVLLPDAPRTLRPTVSTAAPRSVATQRGTERSFVHSA